MVSPELEELITIEALSRREAHVAVVGLGYVGTPLMAALDRHFSVYGLDTDGRRIAALQRGVDVTGSTEACRIRAMSARFTADASVLGKCSLIIVAVPTPVTSDHLPDLTALEAAARTIGMYIRRGTVVVVESTVYPGVTEDVVGAIIAKISGLPLKQDIHLGYSPERINPGDHKHGLESIVKVVAGQCSAVADLLTGVYGKLTGGRVHQSADIRTAEVAKVIENTQRDLNIALMNELAMICDRLGLDTVEVIRTANTKWNFARYEPGLVGGHCIGVDPYYLTYAAARAGHNAHVILAGRQLNALMGRYVAERAISLLGNRGQPEGRTKALILGLTFKENIPDVRNSQVFDIIDTLNDRRIVCSVFDSEADPQEVQDRYGIHLLEDPIANAPYDLIVVAVRHDTIKSRFPLDVLRLVSVPERPLLIDVKSMYDRAAAERFGFVYWRL